MQNIASSMTQQAQKEAEHRLAKKFVRSIPSLRKYEIRISESPDVILVKETHRIGLELTQMFVSTPDRQKETLRDQLLREAEKAYTQLGGHPVFGWVRFKGLGSTSKSEVVRQGRLLGRVIFETFHDLDQILSFGSDTAALPPLVRNVDVVPLKEGTRTAFTPVGPAFAMPAITSESIRLRIKAKSKKLTRYKARDCSEYWLVIALDTGRGSASYQMEGPALNEKYESPFQRTYLLDFQRAVSHRLETVTVG